MKAIFPLTLAAVVGTMLMTIVPLCNATMFPPHALSVNLGGASVLQFSSGTAMINTGVDTDAAGQINVTLTHEGNANNQQLNISVSKLNPNTSYQLMAFIGDDTSPTGIAAFTTNKKGAFTVSYMKNSQGNPNSRVKPLPNALNPLCNVRELEIVNGSTQAVLQAFLANPDQGLYLVMRPMNNTGFISRAAGNLLILAGQHSTEFQFRASGLTPNTDYNLTLNGILVQTSTSDNKGKLNLTDLPLGSPDVLDIQTVELTDATGANVVLITGGLGIPCTSQAPPTVILTVPADAAASVALNQTVNATFSEAMDPSTISTNNFTVTGPGGTNVTGTVAYVVASKIATFTPADNLETSTTYTNTITIAVKDLTGTAMTVSFVWTFTTGTQIETNLMSINLGRASTFAILATAAISGGGDQINGDVGLHPGSSQGIDPSEINGTIHVNDQAVIDAQTDLLAANDEATSRSANAQTLEGNLGGLTKTPGLYVNGSSTGISGTGANAILTLDAQGDANAVFIFKMGSTLTTDPGTSIVLSGGAQAKNVYWQVGSSATLGTTTIFKGNILAAVTITVNNGAVVDGRLFAGSGGDASGAVTVQSSTITVPAP